MTPGDSPIPSGWQAVSLGTLAEVQLGKMLSAKARQGNGARPYLRNVNVRWHHIDTSEMVEMDFDQRELQKYQLAPGDVLVCEGGEPGRAAVWQDQMKGALYQKALHRVRFRDGVLDPTLFVYQLELAAISGVLSRRFTGSTIKHLPRQTFIEWPVLVPPLAEQRRIVSALEEHLSDLDAAVAGLKRARSTFERYRQSVLSKPFEGCEPEMSGPAVRGRWRWSRLSDMIDPSRALTYGVIKLGDEVPDGVPTLRSSNVRSLQLDVDRVKCIAKDLSDAYKRTVLRGGEVLVTVRGTLGGVVVVPESCRGFNVSREVAVLPLADLDLSGLVSLYIASPQAQRWLSARARGIAYMGINIETLKELPVPIPDRRTRLEIVEEAERRLALGQRTAAEIDVQLARATRLRQSILKRAFDGSLVPQDPSDEPASVLLDRIRGMQPPTNARVSSRPAHKPISRGSR